MSGRMRSMGSLIAGAMPLMILAVGVLSYANSFAGQFVYDDYKMIVDNPALTSVLPIVPRGRWLADLTFSLNYYCGGLNTADYHLVNLMIHLLGGLLLYGFVRRTLLLPVFRGRYIESCTWLAGISSALWTAHPLQTESVTYICQRYESLAGMFVLLSMYSFVRAADTRGKLKWYILCVISCIMGISAKQVAVVVPVLLLLFDWVFLSRTLGEMLRKNWKIHLATCATWALFICFFAGSLSTNLRAGGQAPPSRDIGHMVLSQGVATLHLLRLAIYPRGLCLDYSWPTSSLEFESVVACIVIMLLVLGTAWLTWRRYAWGFIGAWFFLLLFPSAGIVFPLYDIITEHRMYLPLAGVVVAAVMIVHTCIVRLFRDRMLRRNMYAGGVIVGFVLITWFGWMTVSRNRIYYSGETVWRDVLAKNPDNLRAYINLTYELLDQSRFDDAAEVASRALARMPDLAGMSADERAEMGRHAKHIAEFYIPVCYARAKNVLGIQMLEGRDAEAAVRFFDDAILVQPRMVDAWENKAVAMEMMGELDEAVLLWKESMRIAPGRVYSMVRLAALLTARGDCGEACSLLKDAVRSSPESFVARYNLAWFLATCPDHELRDIDSAKELAGQILEDCGGQRDRLIPLLSAIEEAGD